MANHLLTLPLEIREIILEFVLLSSRPTPKYLDPLNTTRDLLEKDTQNNKFLWPGPIKYLKAHLPHPADGLLLTNHQLRIETRAAWKRLNPSRECLIDVMLAKDNELWPTLLSVYNPTNHFEKVRLQFRGVDFPSRLMINDRSNMDANCDWEDDRVMRLGSILMDLVYNFLSAGSLPNHGPQEELDNDEDARVAEMRRKRISIATLEIEVLPPEYYSVLKPMDKYSAVSYVTANSWHSAR